MTSIARTNLLRAVGMNGEMKAGRKKATDSVDYLVSIHTLRCATWRTYDDFLVDKMLAARTKVDEVGGDAHHDDSAGPLYQASDELQRTSNGTREHGYYY